MCNKREQTILGIAAWLAVLAVPAPAALYTFINFDGPGSGTNAGTGTNINGIANNGAAVGFATNNDGTFTNFVRNADGTFTTLNIARTSPMAFGINAAGTVVGTANQTAFVLPQGGAAQTLSGTGAGSTAFGINDAGNIVGQVTNGFGTPGFFLTNSTSPTTISILAPSGPDTVNARGVNANGLIVGFYVGTDGQDHGLYARTAQIRGQTVTGTPIADPRIPPVPGEPGATFVFSHILAVNDAGIAVGYYGDSTGSEHGFLYDTNTGQYTFVDDPAQQFSNGVEVTQITGINNAGQLSGFYSDANGVFHGFVTAGSVTTPEPGSLAAAGFGLLAVWAAGRRRKR